MDIKGRGLSEFKMKFHIKLLRIINQKSLKLQFLQFMAILRRSSHRQHGRHHNLLRMRAINQRSNCTRPRRWPLQLGCCAARWNFRESNRRNVRRIARRQGCRNETSRRDHEEAVSGSAILCDFLECFVRSRKRWTKQLWHGQFNYGANCREKSARWTRWQGNSVGSNWRCWLAVGFAREEFGYGD